MEKTISEHDDFFFFNTIGSGRSDPVTLDSNLKRSAPAFVKKGLFSREINGKLISRIIARLLYIPSRCILKLMLLFLTSQDVMITGTVSIQLEAIPFNLNFNAYLVELFFRCADW
jgi:hypothetical protein